MNFFAMWFRWTGVFDWYRLTNWQECLRHPGREPKDNPRFVVTNLKHSPRHLYEAIYCARGDIENRIKELHYGLEIDRTSCSRFLANSCAAF